MSNFDRYKKDLKRLIANGNRLHLSLQRELLDGFDRELKKKYGDKSKEVIDNLPSFEEHYQSWYSESKVLIRQLLPDRLEDFSRHYEKPKSRKALTCESYRIEDCLQGIQITLRSGETVTGRKDAIPHFRQQLAILKAVESRFESSLFDIQQLVRADLFDSELDAARELGQKGFFRAAGAVAGVVLEKHLHQVCENHMVVAKKNPGLADLNEALKQAGTIELVQWRFIQHLADIRNICDHDKKREPTVEMVNELLDGVAKTTKTLF